MLIEAFRKRPDLQLLLAAARPSVSPETSERIRTLVGDNTDWPGVLRLASEHGVRPLLYRSLQSTCPDRVPDAVIGELLGFIRSDVAHNLSQNAELVRLLKGLGERGVPAIPFKGAILADWAFTDASLRESGDIDIVIRRRHLREAVTFLLTQDYRSRSGGLEAKLENTTDDNLGRYLRFDRIDGLASVDLQTSLEAPHFTFALDSDELWDRTIRRTFLGETVLSFSTEDLLILLGVHGTKDVWFKLKWICDIAGLIAREQGLDWDRVLRRAAHLRAKRKLLFGCLLAHDLLGADLPERVLAQIHKEPRVLASAKTIVEKYCLSSRRFTDAERATLYFRTADPGERRRRVVRYVRRTLGVLLHPSDKDRRAVSLPAWLSPVYYLVRPVRLVAQFAMRPRLAAQAIREMFESLD